MSHGTEEHLEHSEHIQHAAHDPFDKRVAMTMTIVAAVLAWVTLMSHRSHNETLRLQGEATRFQAEANVFHTQATDKWNEFQANNIRNHEYQAWLQLLPVLAKAPGETGDADKLRGEWSRKVADYKVKLPPLREDAEHLEKRAEAKHEAAEKALEDSEGTHHRGDQFDMAELAVELALVLCSVAVLSKNANFWYAGIVIGLAGTAMAVWGLFLR